MNIKRVSILLLTFLTMIFLGNCEDIIDEAVVSPEDSAAAVALVEEGNALLIPMLNDLFAVSPDSAGSVLMSLDLSQSYTSFQGAFELDWRNQNARLGVGVVGYLRLSQFIMNDDNYGFSAKVFAPFAGEDEEGSLIGYGYGLPLTTASIKGMVAGYYELPLSLARMQFLDLATLEEMKLEIQDEYMPMIDRGLDALDSLAQDPEYVFAISPEKALNTVDINAMSASLYGIKGLFNALLAYNFTIDDTDSTTMINDLSGNTSIFGTMTEGGPERLEDAYASANAMLQKAMDAMDGVSSDAQLMVTLGPDDHTAFLSLKNALSTSLQSTANVEYGFADEHGNFRVDGSLAMAMRQFYQDPVLDLKSLLPDYTITTTTDYIYNQVVLEEQVNLEDAQVIMAGLNNTPVSVEFLYSESRGDTVANVTLGFLSYNMLTASQNSLPAAIWDLWAEFLVVIQDYSDETFNFPEIEFEWSGRVTTGASLTIDGTFQIMYLERTNPYMAPVMTWNAQNRDDWLAQWANPTVNGLFPEFTAEDLAALLGMAWD